MHDEYVSDCISATRMTFSSKSKDMKDYFLSIKIPHSGPNHLLKFQLRPQMSLVG